MFYRKKAQQDINKSVYIARDDRKYKRLYSIFARRWCSRRVGEYVAAVVITWSRSFWKYYTKPEWASIKLLSEKNTTCLATLPALSDSAKTCLDVMTVTEQSFRTSFKYADPAISGVMSLALCPQVVSQAPQHFRSSLGPLKRSNMILRNRLRPTMSCGMSAKSWYMMWPRTTWKHLKASTSTGPQKAIRLKVPLIARFYSLQRQPTYPEA